MFEFKKATKEKSKLRLAIFGPSGAGKTFTGLRLASGLGGNIAVIDTERGSASKYADRFNFDVLDLPTKDIDTYLAGINAAAQAGYNVLIIDSLSHAWKELLDEVEKLAKAKYRGNTWSAWSEGTPKQNKMVDAILDFPGHVIATMRSKTEWATDTTNNGKTKPVRVGLAPEQGKGIEYEFDILMEMSVDHIANIIKDRTGKFQDKMIEKPGEEFGQELSQWLSSGATPEPPPPAPATNGKPEPREKLTYTQLKEKFNAYCGALAERNIYIDPESGDYLPAKMHKAGDKTPDIIAAAITKLFDGNKDQYHAALTNLTGKTSANDLTAIEAAGIFKILFNGAEAIGFDTEPIETAAGDFAVIAEQDDLPF